MRSRMTLKFTKEISQPNFFAFTQAGFWGNFTTLRRIAMHRTITNKTPNSFKTELHKTYSTKSPAEMRIICQNTPAPLPSQSTNCDCVQFYCMRSLSLEDQGASPVNRPSVGSFQSSGKRKVRSKKKKGSITANVAGTKYEIGMVTYYKANTLFKSYS